MEDSQATSKDSTLPAALGRPQSRILRSESPASKAALLIHGMTSSPYELEEVALVLQKEGFDVFVPCLSGHGETLEELRLTPTSDWLEDAVSSRTYLLKSGYENVFMVGQSFGGLLALHAAVETEMKDGDKIVAMAVPLLLSSSLREWVLGTLSYLPESLLDTLGFVKKKTPQDETAFAKERRAFRKHSLGANARMLKIRRQLLARLWKVRCPIFYLQDPQDHHVSGRVPFILRKYCSNTTVVSRWVPGGNHALAMGLRRDYVIDEITSFLCRRGSESA